MTIVSPSELRPENRRRSKRVKARIPVVVRFQTSDKQPISEKTHTITVKDSGEELLGRVTSLGASFMGKTRIAVEFIMPTPGFWDNH
jgi:hypothetical protein